MLQPGAVGQRLVRTGAHAVTRRLPRRPAPAVLQVDLDELREEPGPRRTGRTRGAQARGGPEELLDPGGRPPAPGDLELLDEVRSGGSPGRRRDGKGESV